MDSGRGVETVFSDITATKIAASSKDRFIWPFHASGDITSAAAFDFYRSSFLKVNWGVWIWAPFIPPTRSTLVWRAIHGKLPTSEVLGSFGIHGPSRCSLCCKHAETLDHLFIHCEFADFAIRKITSAFQVDIDTSLGFHHTLLLALRMKFSQRLSSMWRMAWTTLFWFLWKTRNLAVHEDVRPVRTSFIAQLWIFIGEAKTGELGYMENSVVDLVCLNSFNVPLHARPPTKVITVRWIPPMVGWVKLNSDGSMVDGRIAGGGVFRDSMGFVIGAFAQKWGSGLPFEAELRAAMSGLTIAITRGWHRIHLESDSKYVVSAFTEPSSLIIPWWLRAEWDWVQEQITPIQLRVSHIYREGNSVADFLVGYRAIESFIWWDTTPDLVRHLVTKDRYANYSRIC
ncbi:hypothetical protein ACS0TY_022219 [Phlomoides rotata]